jgi:hypothetical protein
MDSHLICPLRLDRHDGHDEASPCIALDGAAAKDDIVHRCRRCAEDPAEILQRLVAHLPDAMKDEVVRKAL